MTIFTKQNRFFVCFLFQLLELNVQDAVVARFGLTIESYPCVTNDSYILQLHRVRKPGMNNVGQHYPVLLMHGMTGSSSDFLVTGKSSLGKIKF